MVSISKLTASVGDDQKLYLDSDKDSYLVYNSTISKVEIWVDGVKKADWG